MRTKLLLLFILCLVISCGDNGGETSQYPSGPNGSAIIKQPTSDATYTTYQDTVTLFGSRNPNTSSVTWENTSSGAMGTGGVDSWIGQCCIVFTCWDCIKYEWAATVPLQDGENEIRIYGDGVWADSIIVTKAPSFGVSGMVAYGGAGQVNIKLTLTDATNPLSTYTAYTDITGSYRFTYIPAGTYTLTPEEPCFTFDPVDRTVVGTTGDIAGTDFTVTARQGATISGRITYAADGRGLYSVSATLSDGSTDIMTVTSNPNGYYTFTCVSDGAYVITPDPSLFGATLSYTPQERGVTVSSGADVSGQDFEAGFVP